MTELCEELDTYQSQVSGHLAVRRRAELVAANRSGYFNVYRVERRTIDFLSERLRGFRDLRSARAESQRLSRKGRSFPTESFESIRMLISTENGLSTRV